MYLAVYIDASEFCKNIITKLASFSISFSLSWEIFSEFDIAAFVVFVGEVYRAAHLKKQWVFVTDGSIAELQSEEFSNSLLAICFCSPYIDDDSFTPINCNLAGSTVSKFYYFCCQFQNDTSTFGSHMIWYDQEKSLLA